MTLWWRLNMTTDLFELFTCSLNSSLTFIFNPETRACLPPFPNYLFNELALSISRHCWGTSSSYPVVWSTYQHCLIVLSSSSYSLVVLPSSLHHLIVLSSSPHYSIALSSSPLYLVVLSSSSYVPPHCLIYLHILQTSPSYSIV